MNCRGIVSSDIAFVIIVGVNERLDPCDDTYDPSASHNTA